MPQQQARKRTAGGHFAPGTSGNPGGRPKSLREVEQLARAYTQEAIRTLADLLHDPTGSVACRAAEILLDRGWGKPVQHTTIVELEEKELQDLTTNELVEQAQIALTVIKGGK